MNILLSPPLVFTFFFGFGLLIYILGKKMAPPFKRTEGKDDTYACGEVMQEQKVHFSYEEFFRIALFYTVMEVGALVIATIPHGGDAFWALLYLFVSGIGIVSLTFNYD